MVVMAVNRYCTDCMEAGEFLPLKLVMMNLDSGVWMCPKDECSFPLSSPMLRSYMEENLSTEKVLFLTGTTIKTIENTSHKTSPSLIHSKVNSISSPSFSMSQNYPESCSSASNSRKRKFSDSGSTRSLGTNGSMNDGSSSRTPSFKSLSLQSPSCDVRKDKFVIPLWENEELLCWLNSLLSLIALNETLKRYKEDCTLSRLLYEYGVAERTFASTKLYTDVKPTLNAIRKLTMSFLQPKMISSFTENDSPMLSLELLFKTNPRLYSDVEIEFSSSFHCASCQFNKTDGYKKVIMSIPEAPPDLNFLDNLYYKRKCYKCNADEQRIDLVIKKFPEMLLVHFDSGVECRKPWRWFNFTSHSGDAYIVTQIIQYQRKKKHFVLWSYSHQEKLWLEADDFKEPLTEYKHERPKCRPREVHLMVLQKISTLESACVNNRSVEKRSESGSLPITPDSVSSPYSGNSSVLAQYSGNSSRQPSICSSDGISPSSSAHVTNQAVTSNETTKHHMHVPRYKPFKGRSKAKVEQASTTVEKGDGGDFTDGVLKQPQESSDSLLFADDATPLDTNILEQVLSGEVDEFFSDLQGQQQLTNGETNSFLQQVDNFDTLSDIVGDVSSGDHENMEEEKRVDFAIIPSSLGNDGFPIEISDDKLDEILNG